MNVAVDLPEPDRLTGVPHPRHAARVLGHDAAEAEVLEAFAAGRFHHAWLITGPNGVGKATLAWKIARFLLSQPFDHRQDGGLFGDAAPVANTLSTDPDSPLAARIAALSEPRLFLVRRSAVDKGDRLSDEIRAVDVRALGRFFALSAADGGRRVVIVDTADEMNVTAANALLKMLEEPPEHVTILLVCNQPTRLLPTIRSRCRTLRLKALSPGDLGQVLEDLGADPGKDAVALAELAAGSAGRAVRLLETQGVEAYATLLNAVYRTDRAALTALAEKAGARNAGERQDVMFDLIDTLVARLARAGSGHLPSGDAAPDERRILVALAPDPTAGRRWADLQSVLSARVEHGRAVNLDPAALILDTLLTITEIAGGQRARA